MAAVVDLALELLGRGTLPVDVGVALAALLAQLPQTVLATWRAPLAKALRAAPERTTSQVAAALLDDVSL